MNNLVETFCIGVVVTIVSAAAAVLYWMVNADIDRYLISKQDGRQAFRDFN